MFGLESDKLIEVSIDLGMQSERIDGPRLLGARSRVWIDNMDGRCGRAHVQENCALGLHEKQEWARIWRVSLGNVPEGVTGEPPRASAAY